MKHLKMIYYVFTMTLECKPGHLNAGISCSQYGSNRGVAHEHPHIRFFQSKISHIFYICHHRPKIEDWSKWWHWGNPRATKWWHRISACEIQISHTAWCSDFPRPVPDNSIWEGTKHPNTSKFTLLYLVPTYQQAAYKFLKLNLTNCLHYVTYLSECCSGKSIALALLRRFYDPDAGHILLDRVDIQKFQLRWLSQQLYVKNHLCSITRSRQTSPTERKGKRQTPMLWLLHDWQMLTSSSVHCIR